MVFFMLLLTLASKLFYLVLETLDARIHIFHNLNIVRHGIICNPVFPTEFHHKVWFQKMEAFVERRREAIVQLVLDKEGHQLLNYFIIMALACEFNGILKRLWFNFPWHTSLPYKACPSYTIR